MSTPQSLDELVDELARSGPERAAMTRALQLMPYAVREVAPPADLRSRVLARIAEARVGPAFEAGGSYFARAVLLPWIPLADGIQVKLLYTDEASGAQTALVRMAPGRAFPPHPHQDIEDLYLVEGEAWVGETCMRTGDYCRAPARVPPRRCPHEGLIGARPRCEPLAAGQCHAPFMPLKQCVNARPSWLVHGSDIWDL